MAEGGRGETMKLATATVIAVLAMAPAAHAQGQPPGWTVNSMLTGCHSLAGRSPQNTLMSMW
jgi:hypothetical protein